MALVQSAGRLAPGAVDPATGLHSRAVRSGPSNAGRGCGSAPAGVHLLREVALGKSAVPSPDRHVGDGLVVAGQIRALVQAPFEYIA